MEKDDLAALCEGLTREQVDRVHRLLHQWGVGPEDSLPTQLSLLTLAQLRAAAAVPRVIADDRKWLEQHLAEYRRQTQALGDDFNQTLQRKTHDFEVAMSTHAKSVERAAAQIQAQLDIAEDVARRVELLTADAASQWDAVKAATTLQCERVQEVSNDLQDRFDWRVILRFAAFFVLVSAVSVMAGHLFWKHRMAQLRRWHRARMRFPLSVAARRVKVEFPRRPRISTLTRRPAPVLAL